MRVKRKERPSRKVRLFLQALEERTTPANFVVSNLNDAGINSFREAVALANADSVADNIIFDSTLLGSINIAASSYSITNPVTIIGPGMNRVAVNGNGVVRVLDTTGAPAGTAISISGLTIRNGFTFTNGGGLSAGDEAVTLTDCTLASNFASQNGGAVNLANAAGSLVAERCVFTGNSALSGGGAVTIAQASSLTIRDSLLNNNSAGNYGGAISFLNSGSILLERTTVAGNTAGIGDGGGLFFTGGAGAGGFNIRNCTLTGNITAASGGGISIDYGNSTYTIQNSTVSGNTAKNGFGGGIDTDNIGVLDVESSVIARNFNPLAPDVSHAGATQAKSSLIGSPTGFTLTDQGGNLPFGTDPKLNSLSFRGNFLPTLLPTMDSPLLEAGSNPGGGAKDNLGNARVVGTIDIGAVEVQTGAKYVVSNTGDSGSGSLRQAVLNANGNPGPDLVTFDPSVFSVGVKTIALLSQITITDAVTIAGPGANLLGVSGNNLVRVFDTSTALVGTKIEFSDLAVISGKATNGAGLLIGAQIVTFNDCLISGNNATGNDGGGIHVFGGGSLIIRGSTFTANRAMFGAAIDFFSSGGSLLLENSTLSGNTATSNGGALYFSGNAGPGGLVIRNSTVTANSAVTGGGIFRAAAGTGNFSLVNSIVSGNLAPTHSDLSIQTAGNNLDANFSAIGFNAGFTLTPSSGSNLPFGSALLLSAFGPAGGTTPVHVPGSGSPLIGAAFPLGMQAFDQRGAGFARHLGTGQDIGAAEATAGVTFNFEVTSTLDSGPGTLRQALQNANLNISSDKIIFAGPAFGGPATINLKSGELTATDNVTITGTGAQNLTISGSNISQIFRFDSVTTTSSVSDMTIRDGAGGSNPGGGIAVGKSSFGLLNTILINNKTNSNGGAVSVGAGGTCIIASTTMMGNSAVNGGAIHANAADFFSINNSTVTGNSAPFGGAFYFNGNFPTGLRIHSSTVIGNTTGNPVSGAVHRSGGSTGLEIHSSIVSGNTIAGSIPVEIRNTGGGLVTVSFSALGSTNGFIYTGGAGNLPIASNLKLGPLSLYGGTLPVFRPDADSPVISQGSNVFAYPTDQRGFTRVIGPGPDIGAVETGMAQIASLVRSQPAGPPTATSKVTWMMTLNTVGVAGLSPANFILTGPGAVGAAITSVNASSGLTYNVTASTAAEGTLGLTLANSNDTNFNITNVPFVGESYIVNKLPLTVSLLNASDSLISDIDVGPSKFGLTAVFSEAMDTTSTPSFSFPALEDPGSSLSLASSSWLNSTTFQAIYNVNDFNLSLANIDAKIAGGKDSGGNAFTLFIQPNLFSIDTANPIVVAISRNDPVNNKLPSVSWNVSFSEPVTGVDKNNFAIFNGGLTGSPAISSVTGGPATYTVTATTGSAGAGNLALLAVNSGAVADSAGNSLAALPLAGPAYGLDFISPAAANLTLNSLLLHDANVGPTGFTATLKYNELMDQTVNPTVSFPAEFPASLTFNSGAWIDACTYQAKFNVADLGVTQNDIDLRFSGGQDLVGNVQSPFDAVDVFDIDTQNPIVSSIFSATANGAYGIGAVIDVTLNFSEQVNLVGTLTVTLDTGAVVSIVGPASGASLSGTYTVAAGQNSPDLNVTSIVLTGGSTLRDDATNSSVLTLPASNLANNAAIVVSTTAAVTNFTVNDGDVQRSRLTKISVNFSSPVDAATLAPTLTRTAATASGTVGTVVDLSNGLIVLPASGLVSSVTLTFANVLTAGIDYASLADGRWRLAIPSLSYQSTLNDPILRRLFGDTDNNGTVDGGDLGGFGMAFGSTGVSPFDFNNDLTVDALDFGEFGARFGLTL